MTESISEASAAASATALQTSVPVQIASDLHLEFFASKLDEAGREAKFSELIKPAAPILALLGDIGVLGTPNTASGQDGTAVHTNTKIVNESSLSVVDIYCKSNSNCSLGNLTDNSTHARWSCQTHLDCLYLVVLLAV